MLHVLRGEPKRRVIFHEVVVKDGVLVARAVENWASSVNRVK